MKTIAILLFIALPAPALAKETLGVFGDWGAFKTARGCYAVTQSSSAAQGRKSPATLGVARFAGQRGVQASMSLGTAARSAKLTVGGQGFSPRIEGDMAWMPDANGDAILIAAMARSSSAASTLVSARGNRLADRFSLTGFANALRAIQSACR
jgi:hypothetical protein